MFGARRLRGQPELPWSHYKVKSKGQAVQANRDIKPGERIMMEEPLVTFPRIPHDVIDPEQILSSCKSRPGKKTANGVNMIAAELQELPPEKLKAIRALHGPPPSEDDEVDASDMLKIARNAFTHKSRVRLHEYANIQVYNNISRVNHSCKPNAVVEWNEELGKGTLHALTEIKDADEITIDYLCVAEDSLSPISCRRKHLKATYAFNCTCAACGPEGKRPGKNEEVPPAFQPSEDDQKIRAKAKALFKDIRFDRIQINFDPKEIEQEVEDKRSRQLGLLKDYIAALKDLGVHDFKLADAYQARGSYEEQGICLAEYKREKGKKKAALRGLPDNTTQEFLSASLEEWKRCHGAQMLCLGKDHPDTKKTLSKVVDLMERLVPFSLEGQGL